MALFDKLAGYASVETGTDYVSEFFVEGEKSYNNFNSYETKLY